MFKKIEIDIEKKLKKTLEYFFAFLEKGMLRRKLVFLINPLILLFFPLF
jgi:hypothetical protein